MVIVDLFLSSSEWQSKVIRLEVSELCSITVRLLMSCCLYHQGGEQNQCCQHQSPPTLIDLATTIATTTTSSVVFCVCVCVCHSAWFLHLTCWLPRSSQVVVVVVDVDVLPPHSAPRVSSPVVSVCLSVCVFPQ